MLHFICSIKIVNLLGLHNLVIELSNNSIKHLAIVGKNNSGKTVLLDNIQKFLDSIKNNHIAFLEDWLYERDELRRNQQVLANNLKFADAASTVNLIKMQQKITEIALEEISFKLAQYKTDLLYCKFNSPESLYTDFATHKLLLIYFTENRKFIANPNEHDSYYQDFIAYLVQLKKGFLAHATNNALSWLAVFERCFAELIQDYDLQMLWEDEQQNFILVNNKTGRKFSLLELSKGHLAILGIVARIIAKAKEVNMAVNNIKGIILIDEVELNLDINLQERVLPFLSQLFSQVQFIISSHNIGVVNQAANFVVFQL